MGSKDIVDIVTALLWIRQETSVPVASFRSGSSELELVPELPSKGSIGVVVIWIIFLLYLVRIRSPCHRGFGSNHDEVS